MPQTPNSADKNSRLGEDFARQADEKGPGFFRELVGFLLHNKKWWLIPILLVLVLMGLVVLVAAPGSPLAPLIYTLF